MFFTCSSRFVLCSSNRTSVSVPSVQCRYVSSADLSSSACYCSVNTRWKLSADPPRVPHMSPLSKKLPGMTTPQSIWPWGTAAQRQKSLLPCKNKTSTFCYHQQPLCATASVSKFELRRCRSSKIILSSAQSWADHFLISPESKWFEVINLITDDQFIITHWLPRCQCSHSM